MWLRPGIRVFAIGVMCAVWLWQNWLSSSSAQQRPHAVTEGQLRINQPNGGFCPLKQTTVKAAVSGFISRVTVTQEFQNPSAETIEALYVFPLSQRAACLAPFICADARGKVRLSARFS